MPGILIVGATRGLGASIIKQYASQESAVVYGTTRSGSPPSGFPENINWLRDIDLMSEDVGGKLVGSLGNSKPLSTVVSRSYSDSDT
jgi:NAD(P)-dependent dehydrogenase (short-subunit alcohol dehydrogenase family)